MLAGVLAPPADADVVSDLRDDLLASGTTPVEVHVDAIQPTTITLNEDSTTTVFGELKPFLSPDPAAPLPVPHVTLRVSDGAPLAGVALTPGIDPVYTTAAPEILEAQHAAYEAVKHSLAAGHALAGVEIDIEDSSGLASRLLVAMPDLSSYPPDQPDGTMPPEMVAAAIRGTLPTWAQAATLEIVEDAADERVVRLRLVMPSTALAALDPRSITEALENAQGDLTDEGANIGRTIVRIEDPHQEPLYASASDAVFGARRTTWYSPRVRAYAHGPVGATRSAIAGAEHTVARLNDTATAVE